MDSNVTARPPFHVYRDTDPAIAGSPAISKGAVPKGAVIALGNFDGVHLGHRAVIAAALQMAARHQRPAFAMTFEPHPGAFFSPGTPQFRLANENAKLRLLAATGLDGAIVMAFDAERAATTALDFIHRDLAHRLAISGVAVGYDFHFGKGRTGSPNLLLGEGDKLGIEVHIEPRFALDGKPVSSSAIRAALSDGRVEDAAKLLGYPWFASGAVIHGEKRGRDLGYPTANVRLDPGCKLRHGIYAVRVGQRGKEHAGKGNDNKLIDGVASFGRRPTFDNGAPLLEVFLFDFKGDLYGETLDIALIGFLRDEMKFDSIEPLIAQMDDDSARARALLADRPGVFPPLGMPIEAKA